MFDVLPEFFFHHNELVRMAALEVSYDSISEVQIHVIS